MALVLVVVMRACGGSTAPNETAASKSSPTRSDATTDAEPHEVDAGSTAAAERHPVGDDAAGAPTEAQGAGAGRPASSATVVAGRCICAGAPVVGAVVQIAAIATPDDDARRVSGSSDRSGVFSVSVPGGGARQLLFRCSAPGYATRAATLEVREGQAELQLGDVHMPIACSIEGYVRTADGAPVEDVIVVAEAQAELPRDLPHGTMSVRSTRSDAQGQYQLADLPAAPWRLVASKPGLRESAKSEIDARGGGVHQADFVVELLAPIEGIAMLENGSPVPGVGVAAFDAASGRRVSLPVRTSEEGRFHVRLGAADRAPDDVAIGLSDDSRYTATPVATTWGTAGVTLLLRARPAVRLRVVDAASGADVASYAYRLHATRELGGRLQQAEPTDGVCAIDVADPAATWIHVLPP
ncbi:MAG: carboxypeptidase regulatory-like domain-containing protein, partial [Planctomycetota bacterium]